MISKAPKFNLNATVYWSCFSTMLAPKSDGLEPIQTPKVYRHTKSRLLVLTNYAKVRLYLLAMSEAPRHIKVRRPATLKSIIVEITYLCHARSSRGLCWCCQINKKLLVIEKRPIVVSRFHANSYLCIYSIYWTRKGWKLYISGINIISYFLSIWLVDCCHMPVV